MATLPHSIIPVRYIVVFMIFLGMMFNYILRVNINITLVAMVNYTALPEDNDTKSGQCGRNSSSSAKPPQQDGPFVWDEDTTGEILAAFYYGYIFTQLLGGRLAELVSAKHTFGVPMLLTVILTLLVPVAANHDWRLLFALRVAMGVVLGVTFPASFVLLSSWVPVEQMNLLVVLAQGGCDMGTVISMPMSSAIISSLGWEAVFYIQGALASIWFFLWLLLVSETPADHWFISDEERQLIAEGVGPQVSAAKPPLPWRKMLTSLPLWAYLLGYFATNWTYFSLLSDLPQYFSDILGEDLSSNALLNSLPYLGLWAFTLVFGWLSDKVVEKSLVRLVNVRRTAQVVASVLPGLLLALIGFLGCRITTILALLVLTIVVQGAGYSLCVLPMNIAPNFSGTISGIGNTLGVTPGFLGPMVVAALTEDHNTVGRWRDSFFFATAVCLAGSTVLLFGISVEEQPWNRPEDTADPRQSKVSMVYPPEDPPKVADMHSENDIDHGL